MPGFNSYGGPARTSRIAMSKTSCTRLHSVRMNAREDLFHQALERFADLLRAGETQLESACLEVGRYEADTAAASLIILVTSNAWAVHDLGVISPTRYPAAASCARCAFEVGAVAAWLLSPDDPFEREGRWLGWFEANERFYTNLSRDLTTISDDLAAAMQRTATHYCDWRTQIEARLPRGRAAKKPSLPVILKELGFSKLYMAYRGISQVVHAEPDAIQLVHKVEYVRKDPSSADDIFDSAGQTNCFGLFVNESSWDIAIRMASWGLMASLPKLLLRTDGMDASMNLLFENQRALHTALEKLSTSGNDSSV